MVLPRSLRLLFVATSLWAAGCDRGDTGDPLLSPPGPTPSTTASAAGANAGRFVQPPRRVHDENPLALPVQSLTIAEGRMVFAPQKIALARAERGSTLELRSVTALGTDGGNVLVRRGRGPPYAVHPGYVIVPREGRLRRGSYVIAPLRRRLRHAVVVAVKGERVTARFTDTGIRLGDRRLRKADLGLQSGGLESGNYAVARRGDGFEHVLLVSSGTWGDGKKRWLTLGYGSEVRLVDEDRLVAMKLDFKPSAGDSVLVSWLGRLVPAKIREVDGKGLFAVSRPRFGADLWVGADSLLPAQPPTR